MVVGLTLSCRKPPDKSEWSKTFGGSEYDEGVSVQQTIDGGFIICGDDNTSYSLNPKGQRAYLIRLDRNGDSLWAKKYDTENFRQHVRTSQALATSDGGYIIVGTVNMHDDYQLESIVFSSIGHDDIIVIKTDRRGELKWRKNYGGETNDEGYSICEAKSGGYIISGTTNSFPYIIRIDRNGRVLWEKVFRSLFSDKNSILETRDQCIVVSGSAVTDTNDIDIYLLKTNPSGDSVWLRVFGEKAIEEFSESIQETADGGYIVAGYRRDRKFKIILNTGCLTCDYSVPNDSTDIYILRTDSNGKILWNRKYGGSFLVEGHSICSTNDSGFAIAGYIDTVIEYTSDNEVKEWDRNVYVMKIDRNGDYLWSKKLGGDDIDEGYDIIQATDGNFVVVGRTYSFGVSIADVYAFKFKVKPVGKVVKVR